jgi:hypothetical protein
LGPNPDPESFEEEFISPPQPTFQKPKKKQSTITNENGDEDIEEEEENNLDRYFDEQEDFFANQDEEEEIELPFTEEELAEKFEGKLEKLKQQMPKSWH